MSSLAAPEPLHIEVAHLAHATVLRLSGELDVYTHGQLRRDVEALEEARDLLVFDLSGVSYMDSSGVGVLVVARRLCKERDALLVLAGLTPQVRKLLRIVQLERLIPVYDTAAEALADRRA